MVAYRRVGGRVRGRRSGATRTKADGNPIVDVDFKIIQFGISGLKVDALQITGESYKPYKVGAPLSVL